MVKVKVCQIPGYHEMAKALLLALLMLPSVLQAEGRDIPYSKMNPLLSVEAQSPLIQIKLSVEVTDASLSFEDVNVWLAKDDEVITSIPVDLEDGRIQLLPMTEQQARRHALRINHPEEAVNINFELKVVSPPSTTMSYRDIFCLVDDANRFINAMAGAMAFFAPKVDTLKFHFSEPATVTISAEAGPLEFETKPDPSMNAGFHSVSIKQSRDLMEINPKVVFTVIPEAIEPLD